MIKEKRISSEQAGFTLIELMIAAAVFSVVLLAAGTALVQVSRMYYKGVITSRTQGASRTAMDDIARTIQFTGGEVKTVNVPDQGTPTAVPVKVTCIGDIRYTYAINVQVYDGVDEGEYDSDNHRMKHALWQDKTSSDGCANNTPDLTAETPSTGGRELLDQYMRLSSFNVGGDDRDRIYQVKIGIAYGDDDVLNFQDQANETGPISCKGLTIGAQWCAFSELTTSVYKRVE